MSGLSLAYFLVLVAAAQCVFGDKHQKPELHTTREHHVLHKMFEGYDKQVAPKDSNGGPVNVKVQLYVRDMRLYSKKMEMGTTVTVRMQWTDSRLSYNDTGFNTFLLSDTHRIWIPDIFFQNERTGHFHQLMTPNVMVKVSPSGDVLYSTRMTLTTSCPMNFKWFPFDSQRCDIRLASYSHSTSQILLEWKTEEPLIVAREQRDNYMLRSAETHNMTQVTATGNYTSLIAAFRFQRSWTRYLWQYFVPTMVAFFIGCLAFWLHPQAVTPRILLGLGAVYGIHHLHVSSGLEPSIVSYTSAFDIWGFMMALLALFGLMESVLMSYIMQRPVEEVTYSTQVLTADPVYGHHEHTVPLVGKTVDSVVRVRERIEARLDKTCRVLFPVLFLIFAAIFWGTCLLMA